MHGISTDLMTTPVTRFAPSPTGMLHIGGARTALFNWLYARHHGGRFLLRIEDTDRERSTEDAKAAILNGMTWLGLDWDDLVYQSERIERHKEVAQKLLDSGHAYYCYCSPEELSQMRETAKAEGRPTGYDGTWRDRDPSEAPDGVDPVVRLKTPRDGDTLIKDHIQGDVRIPNSQLDDYILLRSDGTPTYMLSVVVDDHDMGITHIIRGDDHLTNAARQIPIYQAMGWDIPAFAHQSLIHGSDGAKLSKRHGALAVEAYRDMGYLPEGMRNYLLRLGWSHGDDEIIPTDKAIAWFNLDSVGRAPARFDFDKLNFVNAHYIKETPDTELLELLLPFLAQNHGLTPTEGESERILKALPELKLHAKTLVELSENTEFLLLKRPLPITDKAKKQLGDEARSMLANLHQTLEESGVWTPEALESLIRAFVDTSGLKFGQVGQPLRAALTGGAKSPGIFDVLHALGRDESLARIKDQLAKRP